MLVTSVLFSDNTNHRNLLLPNQTCSSKSGVPRSRTRHKRELYALVHFVSAFYIFKSKWSLHNMKAASKNTKIRTWTDGHVRIQTGMLNYVTIPSGLWSDMTNMVHMAPKLSDCATKWNVTQIALRSALSDVFLFPSLSTHIPYCTNCCFLITPSGLIS